MDAIFTRTKRVTSPSLLLEKYLYSFSLGTQKKKICSAWHFRITATPKTVRKKISWFLRLYCYISFLHFSGYTVKIVSYTKILVQVLEIKMHSSFQKNQTKYFSWDWESISNKQLIHYQTSSSSFTFSVLELVAWSAETYISSAYSPKSWQLDMNV